MTRGGETLNDMDETMDEEGGWAKYFDFCLGGGARGGGGNQIAKKFYFFPARTVGDCFLLIWAYRQPPRKLLNVVYCYMDLINFSNYRCVIP